MPTGRIPRSFVLAVAVLACGPEDPASVPTDATSGPAASPPPRSTSSAHPSSPAAAVPSPAVAVDPVEMDARYEAALPLFDYDAERPIELDRGKPATHEGVTIEEVSYASPAGGEVTALLVSPQASGGYAGLLMLHGSGGSRHDMVREAVRYARLGVIALLLDAPFARRGGEWVRFTPEDRDEQIQLMLDLKRGVDVLAAVGADPERIGFLGYSYGAAMGAGLSGIEKRIRAYVLDVADGGLVEHFTGSDDADSELTAMSVEDRQAWIAAMEPIEPLYFVRHAAPSELLFQSARNDQFIPVEDAKRVHETASQPKTVLWYDSGHGLPTLAWCDQASWLGERLDLARQPWAPACG